MTWRDLASEMIAHVGDLRVLASGSASAVDVDFGETLCVIGLVVLATIMFMATLGGVTGTTAILPILLIFFKMELHIAVAHTSLFTFISTSGRLLYDILTTLDNPEKRTINFQVVIIAAPVIFIASYIGVELELVSSPLLILIVMTIILTYSSVISF